MAAVTIRNLSEEFKHRLKLQALLHNRSMGAEARAILENGIIIDKASKGLGSEIHALFASIGNPDFPEISRDPIRDIAL